MIEIKNLTINIESKTILDKINLKIEKNKTYLLIGKSGSSKTSLCNVIMNFNQYKENIFFDEKMRLGLDISMIFQDFSSCLNPLINVENQVIESLLYYNKCSKKEAIIKAKDLFRKLSLDENILKRYPYELSGGQKQRVMIASCLITKPKLLICDEITSGLDLENENNILEMLKLNNNSKLIITHSINVINKFNENIIYMRDGKIITIGNIDDVLKIENDEYIDSLKFMVNYDKNK